MELTNEILNEWMAEEEILRIGDEGPQISILQALMKKVDPDLYRYGIDEDFGKGTNRGTLLLQQYRLLSEDAAVGPTTRRELVRAYREDWHPGELFDHSTFKVQTFGVFHPSFGNIPDTVLGRPEVGRISTFGGPDDAGDRIYGQAYLRGAKTPKKLIEGQPELVKLGVYRPECSELHKWPMTTDWKRRAKRASTSWALDPNSYYLAMRFRGAMGAWDHNNPRLLIWNEKTGKAVVVLRTDYGPARWTKRLMDLSPGAVRALDLRTDSVARVAWAPDGIPLGPVELRAA